VEACGLKWNSACLSFHRTRRRVATASLVQVRKPTSQRSVDRWRHYAQLLSVDLEEL
jgi:hypothetical protein